MGFLWHNVSEKEKEDIKRQAKKIMDKFSKRLEKVKLDDKPKTSEQGLELEREENSKNEREIDRKIMFENAPDKNKDIIVSEKKKW